MAESAYNNMTMNAPTALLVNREAHTSLQLLRRSLSDDENANDDVEEETEEEEEEEQKDEETEDIEEESDDSPTAVESDNDHLNHSVSATVFPLSSSVYYPVGRGSGSRPKSISPFNPVTAPAGYTFAPVFNQVKSEISSLLQVRTSDQNLTSTSKTTNGYDSHDFSVEKSFNETIDFSFYASTTKLVFDDISSYHRAISCLNQNGIQTEPTRNYPDIWSFCLKSRTTRFYCLSELRSHALNSSEEITVPQAHISPILLFTGEIQFWLVFQRRPIFHETYFNVDPESVEGPSIPVINSTILGRMKFSSSVHLNLSYGALTSMNEYYRHPQYDFSKRTEWTILFRSKKLEIERLEEKRRDNEQNYVRIYKKSILPAELIDRTVIFTVDRLGFKVYICTKGNLHEYTRILSDGKHRYQIERTPAKDNDCPVFSTICLHTVVKTGRRNQYSSDHAKYYALDQVKSLFRYLLDFFYTNQISVCFARIQSYRGCLTNRSLLPNFFTTPIQIYAYTMLRSVGYVVEQKLSRASVSEKLRKLTGDDNDKFYRLCLYLFRRSTEYHFLNLEHELDEADREYNNQLEQCEQLNEEMATILSPPRENYAYVPSIRVTPTTIQIQPLKLVKLHRVLREKNFNDPMSFALVDVRDEANRALYARDFRSLRSKFEHILSHGIQINRTRYRYLHHSMSQVKEKQFWFLDSRYPLEDVLSWMGNFDNERVVAKHAARMAQCFTSTEPSIRISADLVKYIPDIETPDKQYCFTDGVGTLSQEYCKKVQKALGRKFMPSVLQIRYGGCKGTVSVDPCLDDQPHQLIIRYSMLKFKTEHDELEICKVSSPRSLHLNRQDILLLSNRGIPESHFLILQNENHLWLVQALLCSSIAFELLNERVGSTYFHFRDIATTFNLVEEPFFLQLLITCGHDCVSKFQQRAKIKIAKNKARNMFGIVDEYGVLEYGQVFIQYNPLNDEKLDVSDKPPNLPPTILDNVKVVITKNPCYHPGDLRTFMAVDRAELRHLVDVVVFPQKGPRPHPNEISGSDLDGDEYAVIWDSEFIPPSPNDEPYKYDSQEKPVKHDRPVERNDINEVVLNIAAQNLTGDMSNLHLAMADLLDPRDLTVKDLAGLISQELDAPKTGKHPIESEDLHRYRIDILQERYPDFMMKERYRSYPSEKIIGQLYRSARRAIIRWHKAARTHCSLRYLHTAQLEDDSLNADEDLDTPVLHSPSSSTYSRQRQSFDYTANGHEPSLSLDMAIQHPLGRKQEKRAQGLFSYYRETLRNIISVFNYQDEIDLFCRCEALDQLASGKQDLNISAGLELQRLIDTTRRLFYDDFDQLSIDPKLKSLHREPCTRDRTCEGCEELKLARAAACYYVCYSQAAQQSTKARSRILSFPWLFGPLLAKLKKKNEDVNSHSYASKYLVVGRAMRNAAKQLIEKKELKLKILKPAYSEVGHLFLRSIKSTISNSLQSLKRSIIENDRQSHFLCLPKILFIEIMNNWIRKQDVFGERPSPVEKKPTIREICWHQLLIEFISITDEDVPSGNLPFEEYKVVFQSTNISVMTERYLEYIQCEISTPSVHFDDSMYNYCVSLICRCFRIAREHQSTEYAYLSDYLILALQAIGIEKELNDLSIDVSLAT